jgi:predicted amidohydrolase
MPHTEMLVRSYVMRIDLNAHIKSPTLARLLICLFACLLSGGSLAASDWSKRYPREEIAPVFSQTPDGHLVLASQRPGVNGHWLKTFPVKGGKSYRFSAYRLAENIESERRSCLVRIEWSGPNGELVESPHPVNPAYLGGDRDMARPDYPRDQKRLADGSVLVQDTYIAPADATRARVQLHLRWTETGKVTWKDVAFTESQPLLPRIVKLAAVHHNLGGDGKNTIESNRSKVVPLIQKAARKGADLVVLGEMVSCKGVTNIFSEVAEPIPGPTTRFYGKVAQENDCYIVVGLPERDENEVYNVSVMMGPDGKVAGKYRKVALPREEIQQGISPGYEYPVFDTRFGKVGMMICYDVFFPEVARELAMNGAEVIAMPIWGGNPLLAAARCAENGVYLVSSTYTDHSANWMKTAIWDREGNRLAEADEWGTVVMAEVDLNQPTHWQFLGDFQSRIQREAPIRMAE